MFEDALVESTGRIRSSKSWTTTLSFTIQAAILVAVIVIGRFSPQKLLPSPISLSLSVPKLAPNPTPPPRLPRVTASADANAPSAPVAANSARQIAVSTDGPAPSSSYSAFADSVGSTGLKYNSTDLARSISVARTAVSSGRIRVSSGAVQANCISCPPPLYPAAAKAFRISGTVILDALISTTGTVEDLRVISGPPLLRNAAMDAARNWRYKPTILSGQPVDVEAEITVVFHFD